MRVEATDVKREVPYGPLPPNPMMRVVMKIATTMWGHRTVETCGGGDTPWWE
jgi:hypothetical protein